MSFYIIHYFSNEDTGEDDIYRYVGTEDRTHGRLLGHLFRSQEEAKEYAEYQLEHTGYGGCVYRIEEVKPYMNT
jgi:hypothetical protein